MKQSLFLFLFFLFSCNAFAQEALNKADFLIENTRVILSDTVLENVDVVISDGKIEEVAPALSALYAAEETIDGAGKTLVSPFTNAHVHIWFPNQLKEAAQAGVLTLMDMHGSAFSMNILRTFADSIGYARYWAAGAGATVPGGHGTQFGLPTPTIDSTKSAKQFTLDRIAEGVDYIKILREPSRPTISFAQIDTVIQVAHAHGVKVVAHISRKNDAVALAKAGIDGLVHIWIDEPMTAEDLAVFEAADLFIVPTILTNVKLLEYLADMETPFMEALPKDTLLLQIQQLHHAGVRLVAGTDPPNFQINYGTDLYEEIKLFAASGLSPLEALATATTNGAAVFGLSEIPVIRKGATASILLINGDPSQNVADLYQLEMVWDRGEIIFSK